MGRPSKLSPAQWREIQKRVAAGESARALAREYGVSDASVSKRVSVVSKKLRNTAVKLAEARREVALLPPKQQAAVESLADHMLNMGRNLAAAGDHGAATARHLAAVAEKVAIRVTEKNASKSVNNIKAVAVLNRAANEAAQTALTLVTLPAERRPSGGDDDDDGPVLVTLVPVEPRPIQ